MKHIGYLAIVPVLGLLLGPVIHNSSTPFILGMPFLLGWMVIWVVLVSIIMAIIYALDPARVSAQRTHGR
jgi:1,4-dihydroxy-2-naphthoate octaprenyltransferase